MKHIGLIYPYEAQCPVVDDLGDRWRIYYGKRDQYNQSRIYFFEVGKEVMLFQRFVHLETPIVRLGAEGAFDEDGQIPSSIGVVNGVKWLYFTGIRRGGEHRYQNAIGAIRIEEEGFFKLKEPVMEPEKNEWFTSHLMYQHNGVATYCSCREWRNDEPVYDLRMATTNGSGDNWYKQPGIELSLQKNEGGICSLNMNFGNAIFCVRDKEDYRGGKGSYRIETAEWGIEGWKRTGRLEIPREPWCSDMQCYPYLINNHLFYNGNNFGKTGIGCVVLD
jgi:hypothetical protein